MLPPILVVDDDAAVRNMIARQLSDSYEIIQSENAEEALALALRRKPRCILLDFNLPGYSGPELCQMLSSLSATSFIPIVVVTGAPALKFKDYCLNLGAVDFFNKPIDFPKLKTRLADLVTTKVERRRETRFRILVALRITGEDARGNSFEVLTRTENLSANGFMCGCAAELAPGSVVKVSLVSAEKESPVGSARMAHMHHLEGPLRFYGFEFVEKSGHWLIR